MKKIVASQHAADLSFAKLTVESEAGEGAMPRATGWSAQILRTRGCVNARMNILTKRTTDSQAPEETLRALMALY